MPVIDADGHVEEHEATFCDDFLEPAFRDRRPVIVASGNRAFWMCDDRLIPKLVGRACNVMGTPTGYGHVPREITAAKPESVESLELHGTAIRLADNQREDIDLQVLYSTLFLAGPLSADPRLNQALCRSWNRWIAQVCSEDPEHFRWVAVLDLADVAGALTTLREARGLPGNLGVMLLGTVGDRMLDAPDFEPFWAAAAEMDLPVAVHVGWPCPSLNNLYDNLFNSQVAPFVISLFMAFVNAVSSGLFDRYPRLRVAFLEAGTSGCRTGSTGCSTTLRSASASRRSTTAPRSRRSHTSSAATSTSWPRPRSRSYRSARPVRRSVPVVGLGHPALQPRALCPSGICAREDVSDTSRTKLLLGQPTTVLRTRF